MYTTGTPAGARETLLKFVVEDKLPIIVDGGVHWPTAKSTKIPRAWHMSCISVGRSSYLVRSNLHEHQLCTPIVFKYPSCTPRRESSQRCLIPGGSGTKRHPGSVSILSTHSDSLDPKDMDLGELVPGAETLAQREKIQYSTQLTLGSELPTINPHKIYYHRSWQGIQPWADQKHEPCPCKMETICIEMETRHLMQLPRHSLSIWKGRITLDNTLDWCSSIDAPIY